MPASSAGDANVLAVPYRSQLDGNPYEESDCGPASMAMVLDAFGKSVPTMEVRDLVNDLQGTQGDYESGTFIETFPAVAERYGLRPFELQVGDTLRRWSLADVRRHIDAGRPVIPQVWYRGLPGRRNRPYEGDHYMVLIGYVGEWFVYHDPIDKDGPGANRRISMSQLDLAWRNSDFPYAAVAFAGPPRRPSLGTVPLAPLRAFGVN